MSFGCDKSGCPEPAIAGSRKCKAHLREKLLARRGAKAETPDNTACKRCGRLQRDVTGWSDALEMCGACIEARGRAKAKKVEKNMNAEEGPVIRTCPCGEELTPKARKGLCRDCVKKKAQKKFMEKRKAAVDVTINDTNHNGINSVPIDLVNHPPHYTRGKIEVIDFIEDQGLGYHGGNVVKYVCRHRHKGSPVEDLKKARWYLDRLIEREEAEHGA